LNWVKEKFQRKTGITEEIALKFLVDYKYEFHKAVRSLQEKPEEIRSLVNSLSESEAKSEIVGFIHSLNEFSMN
jgi:hypothetical protein